MSKEKNNKYNSDKPINSVDEDLLGRASFSKQLGKSLLDYSGKDTFVVGLFGKWGTGKTSVINMTLQEIENITDDENQPIIVRFSPWNYSAYDNLIVQFLNCIKETADIKIKGELKKVIGGAIENYSNAFEGLSVIPVYGIPIALLLKIAGKRIGKKLSKKHSIEQSKKSLEKALEKLGRKIIVVIDDIDRLSDTQIQDIFRLVKQVADLPNVIYILSMERDVVVKALNGVQQYDGSEYLEKIIQIPFVIPEIDHEKVMSILLKALDKIVEEKNPDAKIDNEYWARILMYCVEPYFKTLRDVNRFINVFRFRYYTLYNEVCLEDIIAITVFEVLNTNLYKWIANNKDAVCGGGKHAFVVQGRKPEEIKDSYLKEFESMNIKNNESVLKMLSTIFPVFAEDIGMYAYGYKEEDRKKMRVSQSERYDLMFAFNLGDLPVSRKTLLDFINIYDEELSEELLDELNGDYRIRFFLGELRAQVSEIPDDRVTQIISVLNKKASVLEDKETKEFLLFSVDGIAYVCIEELLRKLKTDDKKVDIIEQQLKSGDLNRITNICNIIIKIENAYGRFENETIDDDDQIISQSQLEEVEKTFLDAINDLDDMSVLLKNEKCARALYLWEKLDEQHAHEKMNQILTNKDNCLRYVCRMSTRWSGSTGNGWSYREKENDFISADKLKDIIDEYDKKKMFENFNEEELLIIASFILNYGKREDTHVNEKEAKKLLKKWKNETD